MGDNQVTQFKWKIENFGKFHWESNETESNWFELEDLSIVNFCLFYARNGGPLDSNFGVALRSPSRVKSLCVKIRFWVENDFGESTPGWTVENHNFQNAGNMCWVNSRLEDHEPEDVKVCPASDTSTLTFCCEINLVTPIDSVQRPRKLRQCLWNHYVEGQGEVVIIKVDHCKFNIDQLFLAGQSEVLDSMFLTSAELELEDFDAATIEGFVQWLYYGTIREECLLEKLYLFAHKYSIQDLKDHCFALMDFILSDENVMDRLVFSAKFQIEEVKNLALRHITPKSEFGQVMLLMKPSWCKFVIENQELAIRTVASLHPNLE